MPTTPSAEPRRCGARVWALAAATAAMSVLLIAQSGSSGSPSCEQLRRLRVFSHRGRSSGIDGELFGQRQLTDMIAAGVHGFDLDLFFSVDGAIFIGHPSEIHACAIDGRVEARRSVVGETCPSVGSVFTMRGAAVRNSSAPPMEIGALLRASSRARNVTLVLDLKGMHHPGYHRALTALQVRGPDA